MDAVGDTDALMEVSDGSTEASCFVDAEEGDTDKDIAAASTFAEVTKPCKDAFRSAIARFFFCRS